MVGWFHEMLRSSDESVYSHSLRDSRTFCSCKFVMCDFQDEGLQLWTSHQHPGHSF